MTEDETISAAMSLLGRRTSPAKAASARENAAKSPLTKPGRIFSAETRAKMSAAGKRRAERERAAERDRDGG